MTNPQADNPTTAGVAPGTPPFGRTPKRVRAKLKTQGDCSALLATLIREARSGLLPTDHLSRYANALSLLARMIEGSDMEARIDALEKAAMARGVRAGLQ
ncbi:MAG: hypothetical protein ABL956_13070 [Hyphomonadaceae bacterium]